MSIKKVLVTGASGFIGRHLVENLTTAGYQVVNLDISPPLESSQRCFWRQGSILDAAGFARSLAEVRPQYVIHLAALAVMEGRSLDEFKANTDGTANVLAAVRSFGGVERLVITSTQHVRRPGSPPPSHDEDYRPYMLYGESKVITERLTRSVGLTGHWTIIRPTAVWGTHHPFQVNGLWRLMYRGIYFHPAGDPVVRAYGYVGNVAWQIERILSLPAEATHGRTLYVGDENMRQLDWVNKFAQALTGRNVRTVPPSFIRMLAMVGDGMRSCGLRFPMYGSRYFNLTTNNPVPMQPTFDILGRGPTSTEEGVRITADWLRAHYLETELKHRSSKVSSRFSAW